MRALVPMQQAVIDFVEAMEDGDQAAIIKFNDTMRCDPSFIPFTTIDHGTGNDALEAAVLADYTGNGTNLLDALELAVSQFMSRIRFRRSESDHPRVGWRRERIGHFRKRSYCSSRIANSIPSSRSAWAI
jgi:hypothetical protein